MLALGALVATGSPAAASEKMYEYRNTFEYVMPSWDNLCTPGFDDITITASGLVTLKVWEAEDGTLRGQSQLQIRLDGEAADGTRYIGGSQSSSESRIEGSVSYVSSDNKHRLTSLGGAPDFHSRYKTQSTFNLDDYSFTFEIVKDEIECRG